MFYTSIKQLPKTLQRRLPKRGQEIYRKAFNKMWHHHHDPITLPKNVSPIEVAAIVAWIAVKKEYRKKNDRWVRKPVNGTTKTKRKPGKRPKKSQS